jgi:hypothetical protein
MKGLRMSDIISNYPSKRHMRITLFNTGPFFRFTCLIFIIISLISLSCSGRKTKLDKKNLIPEKELVSLLTDIHLADGLLILPKIKASYSSLDSITVYTQIIEKHGYTKEIMDKTMKYYFINDPKKLNKIYDQVMGVLSGMESRVQKQSLVENARLYNQWPGKEFYSSPNLSDRDSSKFDITIPRPGLYTLSFSAVLYPDDQSLNPRPVAYMTFPDSIDSGKRRYMKSFKYLKDGRTHNYSLTIHVHTNSNHVRGWLYYFDNSPAGLKTHIKIENISLIFTSAAIL